MTLLTYCIKLLLGYFSKQQEVKIVYILSSRTQRQIRTNNVPQSPHTSETKQKIYKCIGDDTKAAARQSLNCIKNKKKYSEKRFSIWRREFLHPAMWHVALESWQWIHQVAVPCNVTRSSKIMILNAPGGSTLQCGRWLWDDMPLNSPKRPPYRNSTSGFDFDHITAVDMSFCTSLRNFYPNRTTLGRKKWRHVDFQYGGSQPSWIL